MTEEAEYECPDCGFTMTLWEPGTHPDGTLKAARVRCGQCRRWQWERDAKEVKS